MTAGLVTLVMGIAVGAAAIGGPAAAQVPHAQPEACAGAEDWETDAQALADALDGASGSDAEALLQQLEATGFVPGGRPGGAEDSAEPPASDAGGWLPDAIVELVLSLAAALDGDGDGEVPVTVIDPSGAAGAAPRTDGGSATGQDCPEPRRSDPAPQRDPAQQRDPASQPDPTPRADPTPQPDQDTADADEPSTGSTEGGSAEDESGGAGE